MKAFISWLASDEVTVADSVFFWTFSLSFLIFAVFCNKEENHGRETNVDLPKRDTSEITDKDNETEVVG